MNAHRAPHRAPRWAVALIWVGVALILWACAALPWLLFAPRPVGPPIFITPPASSPAVPQPMPAPPAQQESEKH